MGKLNWRRWSQKSYAHMTGCGRPVPPDLEDAHAMSWVRPMQGRMLGHASEGEQRPLKQDRPSDDQAFEIGRVMRRQGAGTG